MGVKANYTTASLDNYFRKVMDIIKEETIRTLSYLGEQATARIRNRTAEESWIDHTGNLRSSIGYAVSDHGRKQIQSAFQQVLNGTEGATEGKRLLDELVSRYSSTYALIVVAGMSYADYVEALDNKDVLASTELWARSMIDGYLQKTQQRIAKRIENLSV